MEYNSTNNAYDLSLFESRTPYVRASAAAGAGSAARSGKSAGKRTGSKTITPERMAQERRSRKQRKSRSMLVTVLAVTILFVIAVTMLVSSHVASYELTLDIEKANARLTGLEQDYEALSIKYDTKMSDAVVEERAINELGMQKRDNSQTNYLTLNVDNVFEISGHQTNDWYQTSLENILSYSD